MARNMDCLPPEPRSVVCPTCGSNNTAKRQRMWLCAGNFGYCPDAWHDPKPTGEAE